VRLRAFACTLALARPMHRCGAMSAPSQQWCPTEERPSVGPISPVRRAVPPPSFAISAPTTTLPAIAPEALHVSTFRNRPPSDMTITVPAPALNRHSPTVPAPPVNEARPPKAPRDDAEDAPSLLLVRTDGAQSEDIPSATAATTPCPPSGETSVHEGANSIFAGPGANPLKMASGDT
jgi:hypothetical protein